MALAPHEISMLIAVLEADNAAPVAIRGDGRAAARSLAGRGLLAFDGNWMTVTPAGARALIDAKAARFQDFTSGADQLLARLESFRANIDAGLADPSVCDGWEGVPACPFQRAALAALERAGKVERREVDGRVQARVPPALEPI